MLRPVRGRLIFPEPDSFISAEYKLCPHNFCMFDAPSDQVQSLHAGSPASCGATRFQFPEQLHTGIDLMYTPPQSVKLTAQSVFFKPRVGESLCLSVTVLALPFCHSASASIRTALSAPHLQIAFSELSAVILAESSPAVRCELGAD